MCWGCERGWLRQVMMMCMLPLGTMLFAAPPGLRDSLTVKEKAVVNALAESRFKEYMDLLNFISTSNAADDEDAENVRQLMDQACAGPLRLFTGPDAQIEDNVDPSKKAGDLGLDRKVKDYCNDLMLYFQKENAIPVEFHLLKKAEPGIAQKAYTRILYDVVLLGKHKQRKEPYRRHQRVLELVAEKGQNGKWAVRIASDNFYDTTKVFVESKLEHDLAAVASGSAEESAELTDYRNSAEAARADVERERAERTAAYKQAVDAGKAYVVSQDFDQAIDMYEKAKSYDPLAIEPLVLINAAHKAKVEKEQRDRKQFDELMEKAKVLRSMREHKRAQDCYLQAAAIYPDDPRCKPMIDSLDVILKTKADHERFFEAKDYDGSLAEAQRLLRDPKWLNDPEVKVLQARSLRALNRRAEALHMLDMVIMKEPYYAEALRTRADILKAGTPDDRTKAVTDYMVLKNRDVWDITSYHHYAMLLCSDMKRCPEAADVLHEALKREPGNVQTLYLLGRLNSADGMKEYKTALHDLNEAIARDSTCSRCWLERAIALLGLDSTASAEISMRRARSLGLDPSFADRAKDMAALNMQQAKGLLEVQGWENADRIFLRACILNPDDPSYRLAKARNLIHIKRWPEAIADLDIHINNTPAPYEALLDRAYCKLNTGLYAEARADVDRILSNNIEKLAANANLVAGQAAYYMGDVGPAEANLKETMRLDKKNAKAYQFMTLISLKNGRLQEAKSYGKEAVELDPLDRVNHMNLGLALQAAGDENGSVDSFTEALKLGADRGEVEKQIGRSYMLAEKWPDALEHFESQKHLGDDPQVPKWAAECYYADGKYAQALGELNQLLSSHPEVEKEPDFLAQIAFLYVLTDNNGVAKSYLDKAEALDNLYKRTLLTKAAYLWKTERQQEAVDQLHLLQARGLTNEKEMKEWPILKDIPSSKLWKAKAP